MAQNANFHLMAHSLSRNSVASLEEVWHQLQALFHLMLYENGLQLRSLVLMNNHIHGIASSDDSLADLEKFFIKNIEYFTGIEKQHVQIVEIDTFKQFFETYKYIYRNPVEASLCQKVEEYHYSTLGALLGKAPFGVTVIDNMNLVQNPRHVLSWLNNEQPLFW